MLRIVDDTVELVGEADPEASSLIRRLDHVAGALWKLVHRR